MTPKIFRILSAIIGYMITGIASLMYVNQIVNEPSDKVATLALSAFAVIAVLSGLCFALMPCLDRFEDRRVTLYAGEKFFHSSLLIIQTIFLKFAAGVLVSTEWLKNHAWLHFSVSMVSGILITAIAVLATYFFLFGFEALNDHLWERYEGRWRTIRGKMG